MEFWDSFFARMKLSQSCVIFRGFASYLGYFSDSTEIKVIIGGKSHEISRLGGLTSLGFGFWPCLCYVLVK